MDEQAFFQSLRTDREIYIYGAGELGRLLYHRMTDYGISLRAFVETEPCRATVEGVPVISAETCAEQASAPQLVPAVEEDLLAEILLRLHPVNLAEHVVPLPPEAREDMRRKQAEKDLLRPQIMCGALEWKNARPFRDASRILLVSPHPDDEVISCGGVLARHGHKIDVLCVNSAGVNYGEHQPSAERVAEERIRQFYAVMERAGVHDAWIAKIWGIPPMLRQIEAHREAYKRRFDFGSYDVILVPGAHDDHREHRYVANWLIPRILLDTGHRESLLVLRYDAWAPLEQANCFVDISKVMDKKRELIQLYTAGRDGRHWEYISALNQYRGRHLNCAYAEAYQILTAEQYLAPLL